MNYTNIVSTALAYSNRGDIDLIENMDNFLRMVEAKLNREVRIQKQTKRAIISMVDGQEYYGLPSDFLGLRDIETRSASNDSTRATLQYRNPEQFSAAVTSNSSVYIYTIIADQLQVRPSVHGDILEIVYYATLPPLGASNAENWLSIAYPDVYVFGLLIEISAFAKDAEAAALWNTRLVDAISSLSARDQLDRWSGTPLQTSIG